MDHVRPLFERTGVDRALEMVKRHFAADVVTLQKDGREAEVSGLEKWSLNPLVARPIISTPSGHFVMPWPWLIIDKITPNGLYYTGLSAFGESFTNGLGKAFERYVGLHLDLLEGVEVVPEIEYGSQGQLTVDYFVIHPEVVVLVEVKASRPVLATRLGTTEGDDDTIRKLGHAMDQIDHSADLVRSRHAALARVPADRPLVGLVVTLETFHSIREISYDLIPSPSIPTIIAGAHELEGTIGMIRSTPDLGRRILDAYFHPQDLPPALSRARNDLPVRRNPVLEEGWQRFSDS